MTRSFWVAVASAEHVRRGRSEGFMQVCHGKAGPLGRIRPGDLVVYYSPRETMGGNQPLQAFTALGVVSPGQPYQVEMAPGFQPFRRDVTWLKAEKDAPIRPLLQDLSFTAGRQSWGQVFRYGVLRITGDDFRRIAAAMGASLPEDACPA